VRRRRWLAAVGRRLAVRQDNTFAYLYEKSLLRSELFGIYGRMCLVGVVLIWLLSDLWLKSLFLVGIPLLGLVQLSTLADAHRYTFWLELYPVPRQQQASAVLTLVAPLAVAQATLLSAAFALSSGHAGAYTAAVPILSLAAVLLALRFRLRPALRRRFEGGGA
jgi:ABC-2 type transport system permease protein